MNARTVEGPSAAPRQVSLALLRLDRETRTARIDGREVVLRPKEFDLLLTFVEHQGATLSRERLLELVWDFTVPVLTRTVDAHVCQLRRKLVGSGLAIETLRGVGYRLVELT